MLQKCLVYSNIVTYLDTKFSPKPTLDYPFKKGWAPEPSKPFEVASGVFWLRMPIPMSLDHINLWLLKDNDDWVIVDSGVDHESCKAVWNTVFDGFLLGQNITKIIVTHFHLDHIGLASWLAIKCQCPIYMTKGEFDLYHEIVTRDEKVNKETVRSYFHSLGFEDKTRESIVEFFKTETKPKEARVQPEQVEFIAEGEVFSIDGKDWEVVVGNGHSPEHACLFNRKADLLISGDQSLPRISSNVSVFPGSKVADPLGDWITSCEKLRDLIPSSTLILPSHQEPFKRNPDRMQQMINDHHAQLNRLRLSLDEPKNAIGARKEMFQRELDPVQKVLATGETMAHLRYLIVRCEVVSEADKDGVIWFSNSAKKSQLKAR